MINHFLAFQTVSARKKSYKISLSKEFSEYLMENIISEIWKFLAKDYSPGSAFGTIC